MKLSNENIDKLINDIEDFFKKARVSQNDTVKLCLLIEEALLQYQAKFGENYEFNFKMRKILSAMKIIIEKRRNTPCFSYGDISRNIDFRNSTF